MTGLSMTRRALAVALVAAASVFFWFEGRSHRESPPRRVVQWRPMGSWSGRGNAQTESFPTTTGALRFEWRAAHDSPTSGTFQLTLHSAVSGRPIVRAIDQRGAGHDISYVDTSPRTLYGVIVAPDLEWSVTIEEAVPFNIAP
jgi:hypothetical protein